MHQIQMMTEYWKVQAEAEKTRFKQKFRPSISRWRFSWQSLAENNLQKGQNPSWQVNFGATVILQCLQRTCRNLQLSMELIFTGYQVLFQDRRFLKTLQKEGVGFFQLAENVSVVNTDSIQAGKHRQQRGRAQLQTQCFFKHAHEQMKHNQN